MYFKFSLIKIAIFIFSFILLVELPNKSYAQDSYRTLNPAEYGTTDQNAILVCYNAEDTFRRLIIPMFLHDVSEDTVQKSLMNFQPISNTLWITLEAMVDALYQTSNDEGSNSNAVQNFTNKILNTGDFKRMCAKAYLINK